MHLHLQLSQEQQEELTQLSKAFYASIEDRKTPPFPPPKILNQLKEKLKAVLSDQEGFDEIWGKTQTQADLLTLSHDQTDVRNIPWQLATMDRPLLSIAKSSKEVLTPHQPALGYPLKVLIMVSAPQGVTRLAYEKEELALLRAFSPLMSEGLAQVHFTDDGSLTNLREKLEENKYHILHYTGHGSYNNDVGTLALEDPLTGKLKSTSAEEFNHLLADVAQKGHRPELVVLSACQTANGVEAGNLAGVADTLIDSGLPAAIAMSASILDTCAIVFATELYAQLSNGFPLHAAFQKATIAVRNFEIKTLESSKGGYAPGQWVIPQLLLNQQVTHLVDQSAETKTLDFKNDVKIIRGERALVDLRVRPEGYVFIGRRKERQQAMSLLTEGQSVLLRGQGGVGKTALAEHLAIRLLAADPCTKVFTHSEKHPAAQKLLVQMQTYLSKEKKDLTIGRDLEKIDKLTDKFIELLQRVSKDMKAVFLFDNAESFQKYDKEQEAWVWDRDKYDIIDIIEILYQQTPFPLIITGRYPIPELSDLEMVDMNTVPFGDFFRKCHQLKINHLGKTLKTNQTFTGTWRKTGDGGLPTFEEVVQLLHNTFGGNYRALEFFDELYDQKGDDIFGTIRELSDLEDKLSEKEVKDGVLSKMGENLVFERLLGCLDDHEIDILGVLAQYNIPVLPMAVSMQREEVDPVEALERIVDLTLAERQVDVHGTVRYYVMPLVRDLLVVADVGAICFDQKIAGDYHKYVYDHNLEENWVTELSEAFERYYTFREQEEINVVGERLCNFYYEVQEFQLSLSYGIRTEEVAQEKTGGRIWNNLGLIYQLFGHLDRALQCLLKSLKSHKRRKDRQGEGVILNNISQIYDAKGEYDKALEYLEAALKIRREIRDRQGEGVTLNNISQIYRARGDYDRALEYLEDVLVIMVALEDRRFEGGTLNNIGQIYDAKGEYEKALEYLEEALQIIREIGDRQGEGVTLNNIGGIHRVRGNYDKALENLEKALEIIREIGDRHGEGVTLNNISQIYDAKGDYDKALVYLDAALEIRREIGDRRGESITLNNIAQIYEIQGSHEESLKFAQLDLSICREIGDKPGEATSLHNMGGRFFDMNKMEEAIPYLMQAYHIFDQIGSPNKDITASYLSSIIEKIGEDRFQ